MQSNRLNMRLALIAALVQMNLPEPFITRRPVGNYEPPQRAKDEVAVAKAERKRRRRAAKRAALQNKPE